MRKQFLAVACLLCGFTGPALADGTFAGTWDTTYGRMTLTQDGAKVRGSYVFQRQRSTLEGQVEKNKLTFHYQEPSARGEGWFELSADGKSFAGQWREQGTDAWLPWTGKRRGENAADANSFAGLWQTSYGRMRLVQKDKQVNGVYTYTAESTINGKIEGKRLVFTYKEPDAAGEGWFELTDDGQGFKGKWRAKGTPAWSEWTGQRIEPEPGVVWLVVIEANWEADLSEPEYSFGAMLRAFFARTHNVQVRHRFFTDEASLQKWCREVAYLAEPVVVSIATHGSRKGATVNGHTIGAKAIADSFRYAANLRLVNFSACEMMKDKLARDIIDALDADRRFPVSGYATSVDWAESAIIEFTYYELVLVRDLPPSEAAKQLTKLLPFAGDKPIPGAAFAPAGFRLMMPEEKSASVPGE